MSHTFNYLLFLSIFGLFGCKSFKKITIENYMIKGAPNMIQINDTLFCDKTEMSNIDWLLYEFRIKKEYGIAFSELASLLPDTSVWDRFDISENLKEHYYRYPGYRMYPVVGINLNQARKYAEWRTDIVFSSMMSEIGKLPKRNNNRNLPNTTDIEPYVTVKDYFESHPEDNGKIFYFEYRIPTEKEWMSILQSNEIKNIKHKRVNKKLCKEEDPVKLRVVSGKDTTTLLMTNHVISGCPNSLGIYNLNSNVAELIQEEGYTMGGCWIDENSAKGEISKGVITKPNAYTGFRCVGSWKKWGE